MYLKEDPEGSFHSIADILRLRSSRDPGRIAYVFLDFLAGDGIKEHRITYGELDDTASRIASALQTCHRKGDRAFLLFPPGIDYIAAFFACQYAGIIAVPYYPPFSQRNMWQLHSIMSDAKPASVLTTGRFMGSLQASIGKDACPLWLNADELKESDRKAFAYQASPVSFLQYTSGSTSKPKGVMLTQDNLLHNLSLIKAGFGHSAESRGVIWLPPYHDMGLIGGILQPAYAGFPVYLFSPLSFLKKPLRWLQAITRYKATTSGGPNFAYELCIRKTSAEQRQSLDLSSWDLAFNGAEPIEPATLERFTEAFKVCGFKYEAFYPCYGLAESTLIVSGGLKNRPPRITSFERESLQKDRAKPVPEHAQDSKHCVGCGGALQGGEIAVVDPESFMRRGAGRIGEIWVRGPSVASGYWGNPDATDLTFGAFLRDTGEGPYLRTGDLGFIHEGELYITGRIKDTIILRGRNFYPQDIERTAEESHPCLRKGCNAAFMVDTHEESRVVLVQELSRDFEESSDFREEEVMKSIRTAVKVHHGIQIYDVVLIRNNTLSKTSSGKVQRSACRLEYLSGRLDMVPAKPGGPQSGGSRNKETTRSAC